jgi:bla regulator protein BlaR1
MNVLFEVLLAFLNSLWQAALLAAFVWLAMRFASRANAATRFAVWWAVLLVVLVLPAAPRFIVSAREWLSAETLISTRPLYAPAPKPPQVIEVSPLVSVPGTRPSRCPQVVAIVWGLIFLYRLFQLTRSYLYLRGLKRRASVSAEILPGSGRAGELLLSSEIDSPIAVGFSPPAVILPCSLPAQLSEEELNHLLLHERAHLARWDDWTVLIARVLGALLSLHPVALWILRQIEIERESACDDCVVVWTRSAEFYAQSLVRMYELRIAQRTMEPAKLLAAGVFGGHSRLAHRIEMLLRRGREFRGQVSAGFAAASIVAVVGLATLASVAPPWIALAQTARPAFDVASIKRHTEEGGGVEFGARPGGTLRVVNNAMSNVINNAYGIANYQLVGAPGWVNSERYDIEAKGTNTASQKDVMLMLQTLLADRFAMKAHFETREMPAYILTIGKGGHRLHFLNPEDCVQVDRTKPDASAAPNACGNNLTSRNGWRLTHNSMLGVTEVLSRVLRGPVIDRTGIKGTFDLSLQWSDDLAVADNPDGPPSLITALRETLGLDLKSGRGPGEVLVIDHIERPSIN